MESESDNPRREKYSSVACRALLLMLLASGLALPARAFQAASPPLQEQTAGATSQGEKVEEYALPPAIRQKAIEYSRTRYEIYFLSVALSLAIYFFAWRGKFGALLRDRARRISRRNFVQTLIFVPLFLLTVAIVQFPLDYYSSFSVEHHFGRR